MILFQIFIRNLRQSVTKILKKIGDQSENSDRKMQRIFSPKRLQNYRKFRQKILKWSTSRQKIAKQQQISSKGAKKPRFSLKAGEINVNIIKGMRKNIP